MDQDPNTHYDYSNFSSSGGHELHGEQGPGQSNGPSLGTLNEARPKLEVASISQGNNLIDAHPSSATASTSSPTEPTPPRRVDHTYRDYSDFPLEDNGNNRRSMHRNKENFPSKLHHILSSSEYSHIISWMPHGRAWRIHNRPLFLETIIPSYFVQTKYESFSRQLNGWGFKRLHQSGNDCGAYYHECFLRGVPRLVELMKRVKSNRGKVVPHMEGEPDFYDIDRRFPLLRAVPSFAPHQEGATTGYNGSGHHHGSHQMEPFLGYQHHHGPPPHSQPSSSYPTNCYPPPPPYYGTSSHQVGHSQYSHYPQYNDGLHYSYPNSYAASGLPPLYPSNSTYYSGPPPPLPQDDYNHSPQVATPSPDMSVGDVATITQEAPLFPFNSMV